MPRELDTAGFSIPKELGSLALITLNPSDVSPTILGSVNGIIGIGEDPGEVFREAGSVVGEALALPKVSSKQLNKGEMLVWRSSETKSAKQPVVVTLERGKTELRRHKRKYATGELAADRSFYFRGPQGKLKLRAQNLNLFAQLAEGVDDETWMHHLRSHDYSNWFREAVKDKRVADEIATIEYDRRLQPSESRAQVIEIIRKHYTDAT
jgi:hypothetical protein